MSLNHRSLAALMALIVVAACSDSGCAEREPVEAPRWTETWKRLRAELPDPAALEAASDAREQCDAALAALRTAQPDLAGAPTPEVADSFARWHEFALELFFECPRRGGEDGGWPAGAARLAKLEEAVERAIAAPP